MKLKVASLLLLLCGAISSTQAQSGIIVRFENPLQTARTEVMAVSWNELKAQYPKINPEKLVVKDLKTNEQVPYQLETKGGHSVQNLLLYVTVPASGYSEYTLSEGIPVSFTPSVFCRYVPERKDDFAWENDRIAFRMYGKALEGTNENALGMDVWAKKVDYLIIDKWYKTNDYHTDHGEGLDFYSVGMTLGAGDVAPFENGQIVYPANYHRWKVLDNGPLRASFRLEYDTWEVAGRQVSVTKTISLDKGSQLNKIEIAYQWNDDKPLHVAAGLVKRKTAGTLWIDETKGMMAYWEPPVGKNGVIGTACLLEQPALMTIAGNQTLAIFPLNKPETFTYYNGAVWEKAGRITSAGAWIHYLETYHACLQSPVKVSMRPFK